VTLLQRSGAALASALLLAAPLAAAQQPPKDLFKGKVKPGMYEDKVEMDLSGIPGIPREQAKKTTSGQTCVTQADLDKGFMQLEKGCAYTAFKMAGDTAIFTTVCKDGADSQTNEVRVTPTSSGFNSEVKTSSVQGGKPSNSTIKSQSRYLGPCK
jgi:hypothetical protein